MSLFLPDAVLDLTVSAVLLYFYNTTLLAISSLKGLLRIGSRTLTERNTFKNWIWLIWALNTKLKENQSIRNRLNAILGFVLLDPDLHPGWLLLSCLRINMLDCETFQRNPVPTIDSLGHEDSQHCSLTILQIYPPLVVYHFDREEGLRWILLSFCQDNICWSITWSKNYGVCTADIKEIRKISLFKQQIYNICPVITYSKLLRTWLSVIWSRNFLNSWEFWGSAIPSNMTAGYNILVP